MTDNIAPEGFPQMGKHQMTCVGLMADIEEEICALPEEAREMFWLVLSGDLNRFMGLMKAPWAYEDYCKGGIKYSGELLIATNRDHP